MPPRRASPTTVVFIPGLWNAKGSPLAPALADAARGRRALRVIEWRWETEPFEIKPAAADAMCRPSFVGSVVDALEKSVQEARRVWAETNRRIPAEGDRLCEWINARADEGVRLSLVAFSLGARLALRALQGTPPVHNIFRAVFVAGAGSAPEFSTLPEHLRTRETPVNVWSRQDVVLSLLRPLVEHGTPMGVAPIDGVRNVEMPAGHLSYAQHAGKLLELAAPRRW